MATYTEVFEQVATYFPPQKQRAKDGMTHGGLYVYENATGDLFRTAHILVYNRGKRNESGEKVVKFFVNKDELDAYINSFLTMGFELVE